MLPAKIRPAGRALAAAAVGLSCAAAGCATAPPAGGTRSCELVVAYDDSRSTGTVAFPSPTYESVMRFDLPEGEHRPLRLRLQAESAGNLMITLYDSDVFEAPGEPIFTATRELDKAELSNGKDGRWVVEDLGQLKPLKGIVWVGIKKTSGEPSLWSSSVVSGQAFVRNNDPANVMPLLPVKRTPMVRLEFAATKK